MSFMEDPIAQAERLVREAEERVAQGRALVERLERDGHPDLAHTARELLAIHETRLALRREHLRIERKWHGFDP
ncbi:hypothetical protein [Sabulicella rubraurantiaca]|uniref:hypothetical protein n=1 Tax=Sabulicella rubraurantiaca TaxID=2811429 RepID=UPI001A972203|nr:hypothetical protein [Sabulicella rubraurantiaca]